MKPCGASQVSDLTPTGKPIECNLLVVRYDFLPFDWPVVTGSTHPGGRRAGAYSPRTAGIRPS
jgi:hypothetical protein